MTNQTSETTPDGLDVAAVKRVERYLDGRSGDDLIDWNGGGAGPELLASDLTLLLAALDEARREHRDLVSRLGFGDNITEPMANNDTVVRWVEEQVSEASEWRESQSWQNDCVLAGHPADEDCYEHDPARRLEAAEARAAAADRALERVRAELVSEDAQAVLFGVTGTHSEAYGGVTKDEALECAGEVLTHLRRAAFDPAVPATEGGEGK